MKKFYLLFIFGVLSLFILGFRLSESETRIKLKPDNSVAPDSNGRITYATPNTVRVSGANVYADATTITQLTYGATHHEDRPHAVILARADRQADAMLAASRVTHFPVNAPLLYVDQDRLPPETLAELKRLEPDGNTYDEKVQVYLVGSISERVESEVKDKLGYKTRAFRIENPFELSAALDTWAAAVHADHPNEVAIVQYDQLATGLPVVAWNAHMGHGLFYVQGDQIPDATRKALANRLHSFIYLFGDENVISTRVASELSRYEHVVRVPGKDAYEISINFAGYRDFGYDQGYWIGSFKRDFGWGITEAGHNFTFVNPDDWQIAVTGSLLSHMGKHGPMILVRPDGLDDYAVNYLDKVRPSVNSLRGQMNNNGWILGGLDHINWPAQADIDLILEARESSNQ